MEMVIQHTSLGNLFDLFMIAEVQGNVQAHKLASVFFSSNSHVLGDAQAKKTISGILTLSFSSQFPLIRRKESPGFVAFLDLSLDDDAHAVAENGFGAKSRVLLVSQHPAPRMERLQSAERLLLRIHNSRFGVHGWDLRQERTSSTNRFA